MSEKSALTPNSLAFIGLSNEFCRAIINAAETEKEDFVKQMTRLLPRIYISATDLQDMDEYADTTYIDEYLDENTYDDMRRRIEMLLGEDDTYLEVFEEDMKYSDTPIAASVSEGLCDIFQVLYNFIETARDSTEENVMSAIALVAEDFRLYWSRLLCNVLRALNQIRYK